MIAKVRNQTLDSFAGLGVVTHDTMEEYEALSQEEKMDGNVHLILEEEPINANIVEYTDGKTVKDELDDIAEKTGNTDISAIGDGTTTGAIGSLNTHLNEKASITQLNTKQNKKWNHIADSINGAQSKAYSLANYEEVKLCIYGTVNGTQLAFTESFPKEFVSSSRTLRGAGGYGTELDCYQISISSTGCRMDGIWANGTSMLSNSLVQVYAR